MKTMHLSLVAVASATFIASAASADFTGWTFEDASAAVAALPNQSIPAGHIPYRIYANFDNPADVLLNVSVDWSFDSPLFQSAFGTNGPPNPALYGLVSDLAADSYVTIDGSESPNDVGFDPDFQANGFSATGVLGGWFDSNPPTPATAGADGRVMVAQLTLPTAAIGGGPGSAFYQDGGQGSAVQGDGELVIPSPGALALLGLAGLAGRRRRG